MTKQVKHIMIDLETLDVAATAAIAQIGAVTDLGDEFQVNILFESAMKFGTVSGSTLTFWMQQSEKARNSLFEPKGLPLRAALNEFRLWLSNFRSPELEYWAHAAFDFPILEHANQVEFESISLLPFRQLRDLRTIESIYGDIVDYRPREGTHHNALDDAKYQMERLKDLLEVKAKTTSFLSEER